MDSVFFVFLLAEPAGSAEFFYGLHAVFVDILDDELADDDERHREEHARGAEHLAAEDDAEDDGDRMQIERLADERRIDGIVVDLRQDEIKTCRLDGNPRVHRRRQQDTKDRGDRRAEHRHELADARDHREDRGVGQAARRVVEEDDRRRQAADDELAADVGAQRREDAVEEREHAAVVARREETREVDLDVIAVLEQVKRDKEDDDHVDELAEDREQHRQRRFERIDARRFELEPELLELIRQVVIVLDERHLLQFLRDLREVCHEARERRDERARDEQHEHEADQEEGAEHDGRRESAVQMALEPVDERRQEQLQQE